MTIKLVVINIGKIVSAGCIAILFLSVPCLAYFNMPRAIQIGGGGGVTDSILEKHKYYSRALEGFGYGRTNDEGFININDYNSQSVNILVMGSSHMEGLQVPQNKITASVLNKLFNKEKHVYNIGISGHFFPLVAKKLPLAIKRYAPEYVIIETAKIKFDLQELVDIMTADTESVLQKSNVPGIVSRLRSSFIKEITYIRLLNTQIRTLMENTNARNLMGTKELINDDYLETINMVMQRLYHVGVAGSARLIIFYHPHLTLNKDGSASPDTDSKYLEAFKTACSNNNINFVDMTDTFMAAYQINHILPYGFSNSAVGAGHLNKNGHNIIANELFRRINEIEKAGSL